MTEDPTTLDAGAITPPAADDHAPVRLPALRLQHAATARESDIARHDRRVQLGIPSDSGAARTETLRLRHLPPPTGAEAALSRPEIAFPPLAACAKREADAAETLRVLRAMEASLRDKQRETSACFRTLASLQQQSGSGALRALLQQIFALLCRAAYHEPAGNDNDATVGADMDPSVTAAALDELEGHEYFALYARAQQTLEAVQLKKQQLETKLSMERALEQELAAVLRQLARDLHAIRTQHLEHHERVEAERAAVAQLEDDHAALIRQEQHLRRECDGLAAQAERQRTLLDELQSKSAYLDFISRIPLKKHLEQKKLKEQEELLEAVVRKEEAENARLERELAALTAQSAALDEQLESDIARTAQLEDEVAEATRARDLTERDHVRVRGCHTPRPAWDTIVARIPELANNEDVEWDEMQAALSHHTPPGAAAMAARRHHGNQGEEAEEDEGEDEEDEEDEEEDDEEVGGQTQELVGEILQWIERLQKHCGVNLHLSRLWHDVEEARVELNILQHQLDQAVRKFTRYGGRAPAATSPGKRGGGTANAQRTKQEYICALGVHAEIPLFLRHQGKVKCHPLKKSELEALVRKVWTEKRQRERRNPHLRLPLEEVLYEKLHRKYGFQPLIAEWGYNILLSLDMFAWDAELELFLLTLTHAISDQVYLDQELLLDKCAALLARLSESYSNEAFASEHRVLLKDALIALRKFFPLKTATQLQALEKAMIRDMHKMKRGGNDSLLYVDDILPRGANYPRGFFVKVVRQQHFKEVQDYYATLTAELESRDEHKTGELVLRQVREAMLAVDPLADATAVWNALARGMGVKTRVQLEMHEVVPYKAFLRQMNTTGLLKFALNFDAHAEFHWSRLSGDPAATTASKPAGHQRKSFAVAARSRPTTSESMVSVKLS